MRSSNIIPLLLTCCLSSYAQSISPVPADGDSTVTVTFTTLAADASGALYSPPSAKDGDACLVSTSNQLPLKAGVPTKAPFGSTTLVLVTDKPLREGTPVCADVSGLASSKVVVVKAPASPPGFDWGRVRAYFTAGALISQEHNQLSHEDLFVAFRLDKVYWMYGASKKDSTYGSGLHTYFETRLTALPVAVQSCNTSNSSTGATSSSNCSASSSSSSSGSSTDTNTTTQSFLNSQKTARLQFGTFYPLYFQHWKVTGKNGQALTTTNYGLFVAPLIETGFDTSLNGLNQTQQQSTAPSAVQPVGSSSQFYKFYDFGFRLGHDRLSTDSGAAPEEISYLNVGWGRFSNLASLLCPTAQYQGRNSCAAPSGSLFWQRDFRMRLEGLLQVPATNGFSVGFSSNVNFYKKGNSNPVHIEPPDDLRFLFGYKFDITKIASKLAPQNF